MTEYVLGFGNVRLDLVALEDVGVVGWAAIFGDLRKRTEDSVAHSFSRGYATFLTEEQIERLRLELVSAGHVRESEYLTSYNSAVLTDSFFILVFFPIETGVCVDAPV